MKRHLHSQNTGRSYGVLLPLAFSAAVFGVMTLHKLRDRSVCKLFVKEKERELDGLKLLLQKEREQAKETRRQIEGMKSDIHWLAMQKKDLDSRISEMKSTISSLKEEQGTIEVALEEKQSEIKMLREKQMEKKSNDSQVVLLLSETLRQKEAEIEDLKHHLEFSPIKVWSASADDPSNPATSFSTKAAGRRENGRRGSEELHELLNRDDQKNSAEQIDNKASEATHNRKKEVIGEGENMGKAGERFDNVKGKTGDEQSQQLETSQKDVPSSSNTIFQTNKGQRQNTDNHKNGEESYLDKKMYTSDNTSKENEHDRNQVQKQSNEVGMNDKGVTKLQMQENSNSRGTSRVAKDHMRKTRGKRRQIIAKHQVDKSGMHPESRGIARMRNRKFLKVKMRTERVARVGGSILEIRDHQKDKDMDVEMRKKSDEEDYGIEMDKKIQQGEDSALQNNNQKRSERGANSDTGRHKMQDVGTNNDDSPPGKTWPNPNNSADAEEGNQVMNHDMTQKIEKEQEREVSNKETELLQSSREGSTNTALSKKSSISEEARNQKSNEIVQSEEITRTIREDTEPRKAQNFSNSTEHVAIAERDVKEDDNQEVDYYQEPEEEEDHSGGSQDARNQKPDNTARMESKTDRVQEDRDPKHAHNLHYPTKHVKTAERDVRADYHEVENHKNTDEEAGNMTGSVASLGEEGEDGDHNDEV